MEKTCSYAGSWRRRARQLDEAYHDRRPTRKITPQDQTWGASIGPPPSEASHDDSLAIKRWDGVSKRTETWDGMERDSDLWYEDGNCLIHLHAQGSSKRGPSFKVPLGALINADCAPLVARFLPQDPQRPLAHSPRDIKHFARSLGPKREVNLYIAPPFRIDAKRDVFNYHLATRNFFAWVFRKPLVGAHLGQAMVGLLNSMHEFRDGLGDNLADMIEYLEHVGYDKIQNSVDYSLALLHFAKHFQLRDQYVRALAHCVGMYERLQESSEHQYLDNGSKTVLDTVYLDLDTRLHRASCMLSSMLDVELSESCIGLPPGARAHLGRFRRFLISHYSGHLGYYPPRIFDSDLLRMMREDFEALYGLLVDTEYSVNDSMPPIAIGGICTLQTVENLDAATQTETLQHPLPLLPHVASTPKRGRITRIISRSNLRQPDARLLTHTALIKATNWTETSFQNPLVQAYRHFEEMDVFEPAKHVSKPEKVSLADARKVRWLLVYGVYQVLRSVTEEPDSVGEDTDAEYHLAINKDLIPQWREAKSLGFLVRSQTEMVRTSSLVGTPDTSGWKANMSTPMVVEEEEEKLKIEPDVDYHALTHKSTEMAAHWEGPTSRSADMTLTERSNSFSRALSMKRNGTLRRSMLFFKSSSAAPPPVPTASTTTGHHATAETRNSHHDSLAQTRSDQSNNACLSDRSAVIENQTQSPLQESVASWATRSDSTASKGTQKTNDTEISSSGSSSEGCDSPVTNIPEEQEHGESRVHWNTMPPPSKAQGRRRDVVSLIMPQPGRRTSLRRPLTGIFDLSTLHSGLPYEPDTASSPTALKPSAGSPDVSPIEGDRALPRSNSFSFASLSRNNSFSVPRSNSILTRTAALRKNFTMEKGKGDVGSRPISEDFEVVTDERDEWAAMQNWLDASELQGGKGEMGQDDDEDVMEMGWQKASRTPTDAWGDYAELGGLTETR